MVLALEPIQDLNFRLRTTLTTDQKSTFIFFLSLTKIMKIDKNWAQFYKIKYFESQRFHNKSWSPNQIFLTDFVLFKD